MKITGCLVATMALSFGYAGSVEHIVGGLNGMDRKTQGFRRFLAERWDQIYLRPLHHCHFRFPHCAESCVVVAGGMVEAGNQQYIVAPGQVSQPGFVLQDPKG